MSVGQYVIFYRDAQFNPESVAESGKIVENRGDKSLIRLWHKEDEYLEIEIPNSQIKTARTVWKIRGSPLVMDHRPLVVGCFFVGFIWEYITNG